MEPNEYETTWNEGEEPGPITDAVVKAKRKEREDARTEDERAFAEEFDKQPDAKEEKVKS